MRIKHLIILVALLFAPISTAAPAHVGGVVAVCDEAHLLAALAGGGTVTFSCTGKIRLTNTITIAADTTIDGSEHNVKINGNQALRVFWVNSMVMLNLNKITVVGGDAVSGAGIYNDGGTVTVSNSTFAGNIAVDGGNLSYPDSTCPGINADPLLGPLQNNDGPTETMALGPGSAAGGHRP